ncbi:sigma-54-dependent Fis family transcriptional regulator [Roseiconus nitratireducens]|uniref:Sigma-54-dependent Fis family transcriptional regulator n=1 Tax=Roseiconus nitratireducens TaxID=2605748 RepID=A0A5M6DB50_9BACT|nr:sigma-54 dependent transcriptional regulator [Roseiconus nitratireducens]KAA5543736.1 sigma-54-dependent Fis family transcriptional regulator [Roseiconus nitratireducens]
MSQPPIKLLLVEDENDFRNTCARWMERKGHEVTAVAGGAEALEVCRNQSFDVAVFDINMPGMSGMELLQRVQQEKLEMEIIILTGQGTIESAVTAMQMGACDYLTKPCSLGDLEHHCILARDRGQLRRENQQLKAIISRSRPAVELIGSSPSMTQVVKMIHKVAPTDKPVLIQGESGTGKEVAARAIQQCSLLADRPFVTINCAALPEQLVESELFGHQKGSFTGATSDKPGLFEIADGGTLFIDEIGELPLSLQPKLLRVLEDGSMRRIGSHKERFVNVRIIAATNRQLAREVEAGNFREDLFYRINVLSLELPPLREREGDVDRLIDHFLPVPWHVEPQVREALNRYPWPGNVRQLINVIQRATILADGNDVTLDDLPSEIADYAEGSTGTTAAVPVANVDAGDSTAAAPSCETVPSSLKLDDVAKSHVLHVLEMQKGNKAKAARVLGIHRRKLYRLLDRFQQNACENQEASVGAAE